MKKDNRKDSISEWQKQWEEATKGVITKDFFPSVERRLAVNLHLSPCLTTIMTSSGKIRFYLKCLKIIGSQSAHANTAYIQQNIPYSSVKS